MKLEVLYEDNHHLVIIKPAGILSQPDNTNDSSVYTIVKEYLRVKYNKPGNVFVGIVHRLDRMTEGVMVIAKTSKAASRLSEQIKNLETEKKYFAVCLGELPETSGMVMLESMISKSDGISSLSQDGSLAKLSYMVVKVRVGKSLVDITLITGRHHQIRVQFSSIGHPLVGDCLYGAPEGELALCAYSLTFRHVITQEVLTFTCQPSAKPFQLFKRDLEIRG